jgi:hypothetical protein
MSKQRGSQPVVRDQELVACDTLYNAAFYVSCHPHLTRYGHSEGAVATEESHEGRRAAQIP